MRVISENAKGKVKFQRNGIICIYKKLREKYYDA